MGFGRAGNGEFQFPQQWVGVVDQRHVHFKGLTHAGIGEVLLYSLTAGFAGELLANLRELVIATSHRKIRSNRGLRIG